MTAGAFQAEFADALYLATAATRGHAAVHVALDLSRGFSLRALRHAAAHAIDRFAVLGCRYQPRLLRDRWVAATSPLAEVVHVDDCNEIDRQAWIERWINRQIDPTCERPFRIVQRDTASGANLLVSVSHAASDGAGLAAIVHELGCSLYGKKSSAEPARQRGFGRLVRGLSWPQLAALPAAVMTEGLRPLELTRLAARRSPASNGGSCRSRLQTIVLEGPAYEAFRGCCASVNATINDGLAAAIAMLGAGQTDVGPVAIYYTANLRRFLASPKSIAGNLSGGEVIVLPRHAIGSLSETTQSAARVTSEHKRSVPGLGLAVFQWLTIGWMPSAVLRNFAVPRLDTASELLFRKALILTNVGALDRYVEPFGADLLAASVLGPFADALAAPVVMASGLRSSLTLQVCAGSGFPELALDEFARQLAQVLRSAETAETAAPRPTAA